MKTFAFSILAAFFFVAGCNSPRHDSPRALLLVSIDGLKPEYLTHADEHGLKVPYLRKLMGEGEYSRGVHGVLPASTFPAHTTIVTGAWPAVHGIVNNKPFDLKAEPETWYWFSEDIRAATLWDAAAARGMIVGSVNWPATIGQRSIRYNIPEYNQTRTKHDLQVIRALAGPALMDELSAKAGEYSMDLEQGVPRDWSRTMYAIELIRLKHVQFMSIHLTATDHLQHQSGPFTKPVLAALEEEDKMVEQLDAAMRRQHPGAAIAIVSDHGFSAVTKSFKLDAALVRAGIITVKGSGPSVREAGLGEYLALTWSAGGSAAVTLKNRDDAAAKAKVRDALNALAADENNGIARVLDRPAIDALGAAPAADFWVDLKPGYSISTALDGPLVAPTRPIGTHGYSPEHPEMNAFFLLAGGGIEARGDIGEMDMRAIAPRIAGVMGVRNP